VSLYKQLSGGQKAALTRTWQAFVDASSAATDRPLTSRSIEMLDINARFIEHAAVCRARYLWSIRTLWFQMTWEAGKNPTTPKLPAHLFREGLTLDDVLWEQHPSNLFDEIEEASL
jgi:hypothetical protein